MPDEIPGRRVRRRPPAVEEPADEIARQLAELRRDLDRAEECIGRLAMLIAKSTNLTGLLRTIGKGGPTRGLAFGPTVGQPLVDAILEAQRDRQERRS